MQECKFKDFYNFLHGGNDYIKSLKIMKNEKLNRLPVQFIIKKKDPFSKKKLILGKKTLPPKSDQWKYITKTYNIIQCSTYISNHLNPPHKTNFGKPHQ